jgi:hypothetical protein
MKNLTRAHVSLREGPVSSRDCDSLGKSTVNQRLRGVQSRRKFCLFEL